MSLTHQEVTTAQDLILDTFKGFRSDLLAVYGNVEYTHKDDRSTVTEWDVRVESTLQDALQKAYPEIGFQGEESGKSGNETTYWLVDPIDGTNSFIRGLPFCTNMAALVHDGTVIAAVIYDFVNDDSYMAQKGDGAYKNGERISVNANREPKDFFAYSLGRKNFALLNEATKSLGIRLHLPVGAAGNAYIHIATGAIDGLFVLNTREGLHDNAPGLLLAEEAGAQVLSYDGKEGVYRSELIVGSPKLIDLIEHSGLL